MADESAQHSQAGTVDKAIAALQDQIDQLTSTLEHHQRLFERLRAQGVLAAGEPDDARAS
jgi:flagellar biosynthesis chaperone FliJ